ncbi:MAG: type 4a pilus biogenesis protein PilO [Candidatus Sulfotelmatobacter sp.]
MPDLRQTRKKLKTMLAILAAVDVLAAVVYVSPLVGSAETRRMQLNQLQAELNIKTRQVAPLKNLPQKVVIANQEIADFYKKRFPSQNSDIVSELGKLASSNGVRIEQGRFKFEDEEIGRVQPVEMEYAFSGDYTALAKFINALERDQMFFVINSVSLGGEQHGPVKLGVKLETYLKVTS